MNMLPRSTQTGKPNICLRSASPARTASSSNRATSSGGDLRNGGITSSSAAGKQPSCRGLLIWNSHGGCGELDESLMGVVDPGPVLRGQQIQQQSAHYRE